MNSTIPMLSPPPIKQVITGAITSCGWQVVSCKVDVNGSTSVRARRGRVMIAVEAPAVGSSASDAQKKHRGLHQQGIRGLWLLPSTSFAQQGDFPAVCVNWEPRIGYVALLPGQTPYPIQLSTQRPWEWAQIIPLDMFICSALKGRFWYGTIREGQPATVRMDGGFTKCASCHSWTRLCTAIEIISPYPESTYALYQLEQIPAHLLPELLSRDLSSFKIGPIRKRFDRDSRSIMILNSCSCCSATLGPDSIRELAGRQHPITQYPIRVTKRLAVATAQLPTARWRVSLPEEYSSESET